MIVYFVYQIYESNRWEGHSFNDSLTPGKILFGSFLVACKDGKVGQDNSNSVEHGPFFRLKTSRDLPW